MRSEPVKNTQDPRQLELPVGGRTSNAPDGAAERAAEIVESLPTLTGEEVFAAFEELDQLPTDVVREALAVATGPAPDPNRLDEALRRAHGFPPRALRLRTLAVVKDADIFDLGTIVEEQLRLAGKAWDGADLSAEERLDGENEGSFAGTVEHRVLADADARGIAPLFDVLLYADDAGSIFRAGTTELVGAIAYGVVEMTDKRARVAIQEALATPFEEPSRRSEPEAIEEVAAPARVVSTIDSVAKERVAESKPKKADVAGSKKAAAPKERAPTKVAAEKAATKKASTSGSGAKKSAVEKASAKKPGAKKSAVEKASAKKPAAKESAVKKASAKKPAAKESAVKKASAKKAAAKEGAVKKASAKKASTAPDKARAKTKKTAATSKASAKKATSKKSVSKG